MPIYKIPSTGRTVKMVRDMRYGLFYSSIAQMQKVKFREHRSKQLDIYRENAKVARAGLLIRELGLEEARRVKEYGIKSVQRPALRKINEAIRLNQGTYKNGKRVIKYVFAKRRSTVGVREQE